jgi:hypothetical protein
MTGSAAHGIFISYRRDDTRADAGRLYDRLAARFGDERVFMDIDDIHAGQKFMEVLSSTLGMCKVLIVLIGPGWAGARDADGELRLGNADDFVGLELRTALARDIRIVPVLVNRARMPNRDELPAELREFAAYQAIEISDSRFHHDVDELTTVLENAMPAQDPMAGRRKRAAVGWTAAAAAALAALAWGLYDGWHREPGQFRPVAGVAAISRAGDSENLPDATSATLALRNAGAMLTGDDVRAMLVQRNFFDAEWFPAGAGLDPVYEPSIIAGETVVVERRTGLMWQQASAGTQSGFADAAGRIAAMNASAYAGFTDWRLPTLEEAMSLLSPVRAEGGAHVAPVFVTSRSPFVWTADRTADGRHWVVYYYDAIGRPESDQFNAWLRAVRTAR